jgi:RNA polymerase sigma-70 factor (ECF subfamily)
MVALRMDPRIASRVDPSDVVQETLAEACQRMPEYARRRPLPFYPWLRQLACDRLVDLHRRHVQAQRRSVSREAVSEWSLSHESAELLAEKLVGSETGVSQRLMREEQRSQVRAALALLKPRDRDVLVLRYLEQLSLDEAAAALGISKGSFTKRHVRALERLRRLLSGNPSREDAS